MDFIFGVLSKLVYDILKNIWKRLISSPDKIIKGPNSTLKAEHPLQLKLIRSEISARLEDSLVLLNKWRNNNDLITYSEIAEATGNESIKLIEQYFSGDVEAPISFLNIYCHTYNINPDWLKSNKGTPFGQFCKFYKEPHNAASFISEFAPSQIFFVKSKSEYSYFCIVLEKNNDFVVISNYPNWMISDKAGRGGQGQTTSLYVLIKWLNKGTYVKHTITGKKEFRFMFDGIINGVELETDDLLAELINGNQHPSFVHVHVRRNCTSYWWDDFLDLKRTTFSEEEYKKRYGHEFLLAQDIVAFTIAQTMPSYGELLS